MTICSLTLADSVYADAIKVFNCKVQNENLVEIVNSTILGTTVTMNSVHRYLADIKFDEVSETINDLTYGSVEYILLTLAETGVENAINKKSRNKTKPLIKTIHEVINFKNIPIPKNKKFNSF